MLSNTNGNEIENLNENDIENLNELMDSPYENYYQFQQQNHQYWANQYYYFQQQYYGIAPNPIEKSPHTREYYSMFPLNNNGIYSNENSQWNGLLSHLDYNTKQNSQLPIKNGLFDHQNDNENQLIQPQLNAKIDQLSLRDEHIWPSLKQGKQIKP